MFVSDWIATVSLIFGGCCSNAITLERLTSQYPRGGSLITFSQFLLIALYGLPRHIMWTKYGPRFKPRRIPLAPYLVQVGLFYFVSLLNNAAFAYRIPMAVHIIFRSGGLIISLLLGWLVAGKRYNVAQVTSVLLVTVGVVLTTLSAAEPSSSSASTSDDAYQYLTGISILTLALVFSGFLGLVQDYTFSHYGRSHTPESEKTVESQTQPDTGGAWKESMFYLHFLALPMFWFVRHDLSAQFEAVNLGPREHFSFRLPAGLSSALWIPPPLTLPISLIGNSSSPSSFVFLDKSDGRATLTTAIPEAYLPLLLNILTQLLCVAGVHRLTTQVNALTVTLVLVVRKAVSLVLSVAGLGITERATGGVDKTLMWAGATMVFIGTLGYSFGSARRQGKTKKE